MKTFLIAAGIAALMATPAMAAEKSKYQQNIETCASVIISICAGIHADLACRLGDWFFKRTSGRSKRSLIAEHDARMDRMTRDDHGRLAEACYNLAAENGFNSNATREDKHDGEVADARDPDIGLMICTGRQLALCETLKDKTTCALARHLAGIKNPQLLYKTSAALTAEGHKWLGKDTDGSFAKMCDRMIDEHGGADIRKATEDANDQSLAAARDAERDARREADQLGRALLAAPRVQRW